MSNKNIIEDGKNYDINFNKNLSYSSFKKAFNYTINQKNANVFLLEIPADNYLDTNIDSINSMIDNGFEGVYLSFQRPYKNLKHFFNDKGVDTNKICIIDCATAFSGEILRDREKNIFVSKNFDVDELIEIIVDDLSKLDGEKKFVFIDSLSTLALHESFFDLSRFTEKLVELVNKRDFGNVFLVFNVAKNIAQKDLLDIFSAYNDGYIHLNCCN